MNAEHVRKYSDEEWAALQFAFGCSPSRGPAQFACGDSHPAALEQRAAEYEKSVPLMRLAAAALRREIAADPRTVPSHFDLGHTT